MIRKFCVYQIAFLDKAPLLNASQSLISSNAYAGRLVSDKQKLHPYYERIANLDSKGGLHCLNYRGSFNFSNEKKQNGGDSQSRI